MALLTAEDVLNKKFQATKFREGYDQDEVDDFLDEVVATLRTLQTENEQLRLQLAEVEDQGAVPAREDSPQPVEVAPIAEPVAEPVVESPVEPEPQPEPQEEVQTGAPAVAQTVDHSDVDPQSATGMLVLAQRVHDEHVEQGKKEGERILREASAEADRVVQEANQKSEEILGKLEQDRSILERKIEELRVFERDYRTRLRSYLENLLGDLGRIENN